MVSKIKIMLIKGKLDFRIQLPLYSTSYAYIHTRMYVFVMDNHRVILQEAWPLTTYLQPKLCITSNCSARSLAAYNLFTA